MTETDTIREPDTRLSIRRAADRGPGGASWLDSRHTFSFGSYHDSNWMGFRNLRVINDDTVAPGAGFPTHGHRDMEILTWPLEGAIEHKDSTGAGSVIRPGMMQAMSAGSGVTHSEFNHHTDRELRFLQIWILPFVTGTTPTYAEVDFSDRLADGWTLVASSDGERGSLKIKSEDRVFAARPANGITIDFQSAAGRGVWLHVARGRALVNGHELTAGDAIYSDDVDRLEATGVEAAELLLFDLV